MTEPATTPPATPPVTPPVTPPADNCISDFKVPEAYSKEKWIGGIKSVDDLWKQHANAQTLIGKKTVSQAPENPEVYEFKSIEQLKDAPRDPNVDNAVKKLLQKHGLSKEVGEKLVQDYEALVYETNKQALEKQTLLEKDFQTLTQQTFGEQADIVKEDFKKVFYDTIKGKEHLAEKLNALDNTQLTTLLAFSKAIHDKFVGESKVLSGGSSVPPQGDLKSQFQTLSAEKLRVRQDSTLAEHIRSQKLMALNKQMMTISAEASKKGLDLLS